MFLSPARLRPCSITNACETCNDDECGYSCTGACLCGMENFTFSRGLFFTIKLSPAFISVLQFSLPKLSAEAILEREFLVAWPLEKDSLGGRGELRGHALSPFPSLF